MSIRYQLAEFYDTTLDRSQDFGFQVADQARRGLCTLWQNLPGALIPNPGDSFRRGALSALCQDFTPPPPPSAPFQGGQCQASYTVRVSWQGQSGPTGGTCFANSGTSTGSIAGPISLIGTRESSTGNQYFLIVDFGDRNGTVVSISTGGFNRQCGGGSVTGITVQRADGQPDNCGNLPERFPGADIVNEGDTIFEGDTIVEGDRNQAITIDFSPTFEDDVCIGQFVFCADVEGNRITFDAGGVTLQLPGTGGGDSPGGNTDVGDTITNIDNRTTIIQQQQEDCCAAIQLAISQFRNDVNEEFNDSELRQACIVGLIRNATEAVPRFEEASSVRASGTSGDIGITRYVQPLRGDSCFLFIDLEITDRFRGRLYNLRSEGEDVEGGFGHVELCFSDGTVRPPSEAGLRVISSLRTMVWFPYVSSGNQVKISLKPGLNYTVTDPGFRWRPKGLPTCEEVVDPLP